MASTAEKVLRRCAREGKFTQASQILDALKAKKESVTTAMLASAATAALKAERPDAALQLMADVPASEKSVWAVKAAAYAATGDVGSIGKLVRVMADAAEAESGSGAASANPVALSSADENALNPSQGFSWYMEQLKSRGSTEGHVRRTWDVYRVMQQHGINPDNRAYAALYESLQAHGERRGKLAVKMWKNRHYTNAAGADVFVLNSANPGLADVGFRLEFDRPMAGVKKRTDRERPVRRPGARGRGGSDETGAMHAPEPGTLYSGYDLDNFANE